MRRLAPVAVLALAVGLAGILAVLAYRVASGARMSPEPVGGDAIARFEASHAADATEQERRRAAAAARRLHERGVAPSARALGANLLGVLAFENASLEPARADGHVGASAEAFREAIRLDPTNDDAKFNLELVLTLVPEGTAARTEPGAAARPNDGSGAGAAARGGGY